MEWREEDDGLRPALHAGTDLRRHEIQGPGWQRGLPDFECVETGEPVIEEDSRDGLDLWRRVCLGHNLGAATRRNEPCAKGRDCRVDELPGRSVWVSRAAGIGERVGTQLRR